MIIKSGCVSMGTGASLPPQVFVVVNSMKTLVTVCFRALSAGLLSSLSTGQRFDKVHLVVETHKPPVVQNRHIRVGVGKRHIFAFPSIICQTDLHLITRLC